MDTDAAVGQPMDADPRQPVMTQHPPTPLAQSAPPQSERQLVPEAKPTGAQSAAGAAAGKGAEARSLVDAFTNSKFKKWLKESDLETLEKAACVGAKDAARLGSVGAAIARRRAAAAAETPMP